MNEKSCYEFLTETAEAIVRLVSVRIMLNKFLYNFKQLLNDSP